MKYVVFDCDCTFGVENCDVDDGLALLYLLGSKEANLLGVTATYGNNRIEVVSRTLKEMFAALHLNALPMLVGGACAGAYDSDAARFLAKTAAAYPSKLSVLATGSLTNLYGAYLYDTHFFEHVAEIVLMGGITAPLVFEKKEMAELNFSCDPKASFHVLTKGRHVSVLTGNNCLSVLFRKKEYMERLFVPGSRIGAYIREKSDAWFHYNEADYGIDGFYNWDATAAAYLIHPELFRDVQSAFLLSEAALCRGYLEKEQGGEGNAVVKNSFVQQASMEKKTRCMLNLPEIASPDAFKNSLYETWLGVEMKSSINN